MTDGEVTDGVAAQLKVRRLETVIRCIHEREWPAGDKIKAARHARVMWEIADAARQTENF